MRRLARYVCIGLPLVAVAAGWLYWWLCPESPLRTYRFDKHSSFGPQFLAQGRTVLLLGHVGDREKDKEDPPGLLLGDRAWLIDLATGRNLLPDERIEHASGVGDGRAVMVAPAVGGVRIHDAADGRLLLSFADGIRFLRADVWGSTLWLYPKGDAPPIQVWDCYSGERLPDVRPDFVAAGGDGSFYVCRGNDVCTLVDCKTGRTLAQDRSEKLVKARTLEVSTRHNRMAALNHTSGAGVRVSLFSLPELIDQCSIEFPGEFDAYSDRWWLSFSPGGRYLVTNLNRCQLWDISGHQPRRVDPDDTVASPSFNFSDDDSLCVTNDGASKREWAVFRPGDVTPSLYVSEEGSSQSTRPFPLESGQQLCAVRYFDDTRPDWLQRLWRMTGRKRLVDFLNTRVVLIDPTTGRDIRSVPCSSFGQYSPDHKTFWTTHMGDFQVTTPTPVGAATVQIAGGGSMTLREWPLATPGPPWWLWGLTVIGAVIVIASKTRRINRLRKA